MLFFLLESKHVMISIAKFQLPIANSKESRVEVRISQLEIGNRQSAMLLSFYATGDQRLADTFFVARAIAADFFVD